MKKKVKPVVIRCPTPARAPSKFRPKPKSKNAEKKLKRPPRPIVPSGNARDRGQYVSDLFVPWILKPFAFVAIVFQNRQPIRTNATGFWRWLQSHVTPICVIPEIIFFMICFLHLPLIGYIIHAVWFAVSTRNSLINVLTDEVMNKTTYVLSNTTSVHRANNTRGCHINLFQIFDYKSLFLHEYGRELIIVAIFIFVLCLVAILGFFYQNKILILLWILMIVVVWWELEFMAKLKRVRVRRDFTYTFQGIDIAPGTDRMYSRCFSAAQDIYFSNRHSTQEYGPARALDNIFHSYGCCDPWSHVTFIDSNVTFPTTCCKLEWSRNIFCDHMTDIRDKQDVSRKKEHIRSEPCDEALQCQYVALGGLFTRGFRQLVYWHQLLYFIGLVMMFLYMAMLRTMYIFADRFSEGLRQFRFPKQINPEDMLEDSSRGERLEGRDPPNVLLRGHYNEAEFIKNFHGYEDKELNLSPSEDAKDKIAQIRAELDIGNEDLGIPGFGEDDEDEEDDDACKNINAYLQTCSTDFYKEFKEARDEMDKIQKETIDSVQQKVKDQFNEMELEANEKKKEEEEEKSKTIWKWEAKDRYNLNQVLEDVVREHEAELALKKGNKETNAPKPKKSKTKTSKKSSKHKK